MRDLTDVLEEIKQMGHYSLVLHFGEDMGCDDSDTPLAKRRVVIVGAPVGFLGEVRRAWVGTVTSVLAMDVRGEPTELGNPPPRDLPEREGIFAWGADESIAKFMGGDRFENREETK